MLRSRALVQQEVADVAIGRTGLVAAAFLDPNHGVAVFDSESGRVVSELRGPGGEVRSLSFSPDGRWLATGGADGTGAVWDASSGRLVTTLRGHRGTIVAVRFGSDGRQVLTAGKDGTARIHDCRACVPLDRLLASVGDSTSRGLTAEERARFLIP